MPVSKRIAEVRRSSRQILPSMLLCDFGHLADEIDALAAAGAKVLHLDVMDGHFVPNMTYGMTIVEACRRHSDLLLDVHLMISNPGEYVERYIEAGADLLTIHIEAVDEPRALLEQIRAAGATPGVALNPETPTSAIENCLDLCDQVLVMSVKPGFGGQSFDPIAVEKLQWLRDRLPDETILSVDGGVNASTIGRCAAAGTEWFVVGSALLKQDDYAAAYRLLTEQIETAVT